MKVCHIRLASELIDSEGLITFTEVVAKGYAPWAVDPEDVRVVVGLATAIIYFPTVRWGPFDGIVMVEGIVLTDPDGVPLFCQIKHVTLGPGDSIHWDSGTPPPASISWASWPGSTTKHKMIPPVKTKLNPSSGVGFKKKKLSPGLCTARLATTLKHGLNGKVTFTEPTAKGYAPVEISYGDITFAIDSEEEMEVAFSQVTWGPFESFVHVVGCVLLDQDGAVLALAEKAGGDIAPGQTVTWSTDLGVSVSASCKLSEVKPLLSPKPDDPFAAIEQIKKALKFNLAYGGKVDLSKTFNEIQKTFQSLGPAMMQAKQAFDEFFNEQIDLVGGYYGPGPDAPGGHGIDNPPMQVVFDALYGVKQLGKFHTLDSITADAPPEKHAYGQHVCPRCGVLRAFERWVAQDVISCSDCHRVCYVLCDSGVEAGHHKLKRLYQVLASSLQVIARVERFDLLGPNQTLPDLLPRIARVVASPKLKWHVGDPVALDVGENVFLGQVVSERRGGDHAMFRVNLCTVISFSKFQALSKASATDS